MTTIRVRLFLVLFVLSGMPCTDAGAQVPGGPGPQQTIGSDSRDSTAEVARIRKLLSQPPSRLTPPVPIVQPTVLTFYVEVFAYTPPPLPTLAEYLAPSQPKSPFPSVPELEFIAREMQLLHPANAVQAVRGAWYRHKVAKTKREVEAELRAFEALQARNPAKQEAASKRQ